MQDRLSPEFIRPWARFYGSGGVSEEWATLDTGSFFTLIPWAMAEDLGYHPAAARTHVQVATASGIVRAPLIRLDAVAAAGWRVTDVEAICLDLPPQARRRCLLGFSFLQHFDIDLHLKSAHFELRDP